MRIIFLDIDGVLVTPVHIEECLDPENPHATYAGVEAWERDRENAKRPYARFDPRAVEAFNDIIMSTSAHIVISSTWRSRGAAEMAEILDEQGVYGDVVGCTPHLYNHQKRWLHALQGRGNEIADWLGDHPEVERFAILDDDQDMTFLTPHLFATGGRYGLTEEVAGWVVDHLNESTGDGPKEAWGAGDVAGTPNRRTVDYA